MGNTLRGRKQPSCDDTQCDQQSSRSIGAKAPLFAAVSERGLAAVTISTERSKSGSLKLPSHLLPPSDERDLEHFLPEKDITDEGGAAARRSDLNPTLIRTLWELSSESEDSDATT